MKIGIIGGIGTGKSTALEIFKNFGFKTYSADEMNRECMKRKDIRAKLKKKFPEAFNGDEIDTKILRDIIFNDKKRYEDITRILTTNVMCVIARILFEEKGNIAIEMPLPIPLLIQGFDNVVSILADKNDRFKFLKKRGIDRETAKKIMAHQPDEMVYSNLAHATLFNPGEKAIFEFEIRKYLEHIGAI